MQLTSGSATTTLLDKLSGYRSYIEAVPWQEKPTREDTLLEVLEKVDEWIDELEDHEGVWWRLNKSLH